VAALMTVALLAARKNDRQASDELTLGGDLAARARRATQS